MNIQGKEAQQAVEMAPIPQGERIQILDILRGFALLGVLAVNITGFAAPLFWPGYTPPASIPWWDELAVKLVQFFAEAKFYTIFAFLFGLGFSVQLGRAEAKGRDVRSFYPRRLGFLFVLGLLHGALLWTGDILRIYALLGFALMAFRRRSNRALLAWSGFFFALSFALLCVFHGQTGSDTMGIPGLDLVAMARSAYLSSSYLDVVIFQSVASLVIFFFLLLTQGPSVMALFLLGLLAGRVRVFERLAQRRALARRTLLIGAVIGLAGNSALVFAEVSWLRSMGLTLGAPALAMAYVSGLSSLSQTKGGLRILSRLGQVGRMALSNYVLQSLLCSVLFYGFGVGLYERIGAAPLLGLTALIYLLQILLSNAWLKHFQFGPLEWAWRSLTYRKRQPLVRRYETEGKMGGQISTAI